MMRTSTVRLSIVASIAAAVSFLHFGTATVHIQEALGTKVGGTPNIRTTFKILKH
jgi:hypothetical protein